MTPREAQRRRELATHERLSWCHVEELFDRRRDGLAARRRFEEALRWHVAVFGDGRAGTSYCTLLSRLTRAERALGEGAQ